MISARVFARAPLYQIYISILDLHEAAIERHFLQQLKFLRILSGKPNKLSLAAEEVAGFFAKMLDHEYTTKKTSCENFFADWQKVKIDFPCVFTMHGCLGIGKSSCLKSALN